MRYIKNMNPPSEEFAKHYDQFQPVNVVKKLYHKLWFNRSCQLMILKSFRMLLLQINRFSNVMFFSADWTLFILKTHQNKFQRSISFSLACILRNDKTGGWFGRVWSENMPVTTHLLLCIWPLPFYSPLDSRRNLPFKAMDTHQIKTW